MVRNRMLPSTSPFVVQPNPIGSLQGEHIQCLQQL
jgi:hypothetical protein